MDWTKTTARREEKNYVWELVLLILEVNSRSILYHLYIQLQFPRQYRLTYVRLMQRVAVREQFKDVMLDFGLGRSMQVIVQKIPLDCIYCRTQFWSKRSRCEDNRFKFHGL